MRFVKRKLKKSECWSMSCFGFFVRRKTGKKRHKILTDVKNGLMLSKSLFDNAIKALSFCHFGLMENRVKTKAIFAYLCRNDFK